MTNVNTLGYLELKEMRKDLLKELERNMWHIDRVHTKEERELIHENSSELSRRIEVIDERLKDLTNVYGPEEDDDRRYR